jgi:hypothetical protein
MNNRSNMGAASFVHFVKKFQFSYKRTTLTQGFRCDSTQVPELLVVFSFPSLFFFSWMFLVLILWLKVMVPSIRVTTSPQAYPRDNFKKVQIILSDILVSFFWWIMLVIFLHNTEKLFYFTTRVTTR